MQDEPNKKRKARHQLPSFRITTSGIFLEPCPSCGEKSEIKVSASAESSFLTKRLYLYRCANKNCDYYIWADFELRELIRRQLQPVNSPSYYGFHFDEDPEDLSKYKLREVFELPAKIITLFEEAYSCLINRLYPNAAVSFRKLLEHVLKEKGARHGRTNDGRFISIHDMIIDLVEQGKLPSEIRGLCEDIRLFGGRGAHPEEEITEADAMTTFHFADFVVTWLYGDVKSDKT